MKHTRFLPILAIIIFTSCSILNSLHVTGNLSVTGSDKTEKASFKYAAFTTPEEKQKGLSNIPSMDETTVALFELNKEDRTFWMKDMRFPLDLVFFDDNNTFLRSYKDMQPCEKDQLCPEYNIPNKAKWALEANAGVVERYNITMGDSISL